MKLSCPTCQKLVVAAPGTGPGTQVCPECRHELSLAAVFADLQRDGAQHLSRAGWTESHEAGSLVFTFRWQDAEEAKALLALLFMVLILLPALSSTPLLAAFIGALSLVRGYVTLAILRGRWILALCDTRLSLTHQPLWVPSSRALATEDIVCVRPYSYEEMKAPRDWQSSRLLLWGLEVTTRDGLSPRMPLGIPAEDVADYVVRRLNEELSCRRQQGPPTPPAAPSPTPERLAPATP